MRAVQKHASASTVGRNTKMTSQRNSALTYLCWKIEHTTSSEIFMFRYQGNNARTFYIHAISANLPTTIKEFFNGIIAAGGGNDTDGSRKLFLENCYPCNNLLEILEKELNTIAGGTRWKNRK